MELRRAYCGDVVDPTKPYWVLERWENGRVVARGAVVLTRVPERRAHRLGSTGTVLVQERRRACRASRVHAPPGALQRPDARAEKRADGPADEGGLPCA